MSEGDEVHDEICDPLVKRLRRFSPDHAGLDRDALLFAAGQAAARPNRRWQALAGALAVCQLISLTLLWPRILPPATSSPISGVPFAEEPVSGSLRSMETELPDEPGVLRAGMLTDGADVRPPILKGPLVPDEPPLRVFPTPEKSWN